MLLARTLGEIIFILSARVFNRGSILYANRLRDLAYAKVQKLSLQSLAKRTPGDLIRRIMEDTNTIKDFMSDGGRWAVEQVITFTVVMIILLFTDWRMTLLIALPLPLVMVVLSRFRNFIFIRYERQWRKNSKCQSILHDIIKGIRTVKAFGNEENEIRKFAGATRELAKVSSDNEAFWSLLFPSLTFMTSIGEFLILFVGGRNILAGSMSLGVLVQFTMYVTYIYAPLRWLVSFPRWLADAMTSMVKVFEIMDEEVDIEETEDSKCIPITGEVAFEDVSFGYKSYEPVLKDIDLTIQPGEMIGIVGRSGAGKSTMINLLMRLYDPNNGTIRINGESLRDLSPRHVHESIGVVFQDTFLFAGTIYDNVAYAKPGVTPAEVIAACKAANAHEFIIKTPDGYDTLIGESGHTISGGE
ncbi:MAG TPA: ABC transporter ATP-binding protein, partial [Clostridia bacterium]|nr:ABC transporter ATP-binding protein [Clostridia bacterium]